RGIEGLVLAGAFDSIEKNRAKLFNAIEPALEFGHKVQNSKLFAENSLFGEMAEEVKIVEPELPDVEPWSQKEQLAKEREVVGFYISEHPLRKYEVEYKSFATIHFGEAEKLESMDIVRGCGVITELKTKIDKSGRTMAFFTLDDFSGSCEALMFSKVFEEYGQYVKEEECVFIIGKPESSGDAVKIHIDKVIPLEEARETFTESININIDKRKINPESIVALKPVLQKNKGNLPVYFHLYSNGSKPQKFHAKDYRVKLSDDFINSVINILGEDSLFFYSKK
ncbi:MAG: OB-fold nucleic acid binding domain-containing protein, partial [Ignavibacteriaceae bacterium]